MTFSFSRRQMRGAAMILTAAVRGFAVILLSVSVVQGQNGWRVTYTSTQICAVKGSTVEIHCSYTYPYSTYYQVQQKLWFTKGTNKEPVDLKSDSDYKGRVEYRCSGQSCTVRITDLRESDSAEYKFKFITNHPDGGYTGSPGVTLTLRALQVQVITAQHLQGYTQVQLRCHSSCLPDHPSYVWIRNGRNTLSQTSSSIQSSFDRADFISCALKGHESFPSPSVYAPRYVSVWVRPSNEIREGSSVTLTCSGDANPAAKYSWYKKDGQTPLSNEWQLSFSSIRSSESGEFYCTAENKLGRRTSVSISVDVTYAPKLPSVSVSPSAEIVEGSSVTLTCSSDANPAANYTWYKEDEDSAKASGQNFTITDFRPEHRGRYYCVAQNSKGQINKSSVFAAVEYAPKLLSVSVSLSGEIVEGSSVTLTCSSDANPAANYTWYKEDGHKPLSENSQLIFSSIQPSDSGEYYCTAGNKLGTKRMGHNVINVTYAPKLPSVSVSPSAEIVEGSSVTLTCSSDANPAANYTWCKKNDHKPLSENSQLIFTSIQPSDSGEYYCTAGNKLGMKTSGNKLIDVKYAPKLPSVSVSPSAEIVEGSSVTLTCSSDANPAANYTWCKEDEDSPKTSGQNFTITDIRPEHSGNYSCEAKNSRGYQSATLQLIVGTMKLEMMMNIIRLTLVVLMLIPLLLLSIWTRKKKPGNLETGTDQTVDVMQLNSGPVYENIWALKAFTAAQADDTEEQEDLV
ncbi:B-cell receptor CD22-like [Archocentrus centrarchus]|uniref:B-cell receptor CD22-like n=1 Tax=Archocentrus centrarchus TaxID=63155 RepID=UPI0011E9CB4D|nr:B-cell receptor CD22-like [Archocentrus centrarchus]